MLAPLSLVLLSACSTVRLGYNQGPMLAHWWIDGYVDFTAEQAPRARAALDTWFSWHRATQLPEYAALLARLQRLAVDNITPAQVCALMAESERHLAVAYEQAVPAMADIVRSFSPAQVRHIEQRYAKANDEWQRDIGQAHADKRREATLKRWTERAEDIYGRLDDAQRLVLVDALAASPFDPERALAERRARQADILRGLRALQAEGADAARTQAALRAFVAQFSHSPRAEHRAYRERTQQASCTMLARLHASTHAAQRQRAVQWLKDWEEVLRTLVRDGATQRPAGAAPMLP